MSVKCTGKWGRHWLSKLGAGQICQHHHLGEKWGINLTLPLFSSRRHHHSQVSLMQNTTWPSIYHIYSHCSDEVTSKGKLSPVVFHHMPPTVRGSCSISPHDPALWCLSFTMTADLWWRRYGSSWHRKVQNGANYIAVVTCYKSYSCRTIFSCI